MKGSYTSSVPFDENYNVGQENIFSSNNDEYSDTILPPPLEGYFLDLHNNPFLLLNGRNMTLL